MKVAVIGLGDMGLPIARNLAAHGHTVHGFDHDAERSKVAAEHGVRPAASSREAVAGAEIVHVVVFTDEQVRAVVLGEGDLLSALGPQSTIVVHSTIRAGTCADLAQTARQCAVDVVDAGMTGTVAAAEAGQLTLLVGGDAAAVERCRPEFAAFAADVIHLGGPGAGVTGKILNNLLVLANAEALREMIALAVSAGISESDFLDLVGAGTARSWVSERWSVISSTVLGGGDQHFAAMSVKDSSLASDLAVAHGQSVPVVDLVARRLAEIAER